MMVIDDDCRAITTKTITIIVIMTTNVVIIMITWYDGHDDHVEHVVKQQRNAHSHQDKLSLVLGLLVTIRMIMMHV